jgi:hypothetical protein
MISFIKFYFLFFCLWSSSFKAQSQEKGAPIFLTIYNSDFESMIQFELKDSIFSISQIDSFNLPSERFLLRISKDSTINQRIVDSCIATHAFYYPYQLKNPLIKSKDLILKSWLPDGYYFHFEIVGDSLFQTWEQTIIDHKSDGFFNCL